MPQCSFTRPAVRAARSIFERRVTAVRTFAARANRAGLSGGSAQEAGFAKSWLPRVETERDRPFADFHTQVGRCNAASPNLPFAQLAAFGTVEG